MNCGARRNSGCGTTLAALVGLEGFEVKRVIERGDRLDLEVELVARAGCCPHCGRSSVDVKDRPVLRCATCRSRGA